MTANVSKNDIYVMILSLLIIGSITCDIFGFVNNNMTIFFVGAILMLAFGIVLTAFIFSRIGELEKRIDRMERK